MPATPLTDDAWTGLPLLQCDMDPGLYRLDVQRPILVARDLPGSMVEVLNHDHDLPAFRQAPLRFDLFASGLQMNARSDRRSTKSLVVALTDDWMPSDQDGGDGAISLRSRFQFVDVELRRLVWRLTTHHQAGAPLGHDYSGAVSRMLVDRVIRLQLGIDAREPDRVGLHDEARRLVQELIDRNLQEPLSTSALADKVGIGLSRFLREFKTTFKATPQQFVRVRRLARASDLLARTDAPLTTIALETGFASHAHFSTAFRASTGMTPSVYRRRAGEAVAAADGD